jgi:thioredoxin 1
MPLLRLVFSLFKEMRKAMKGFADNGEKFAQAAVMLVVVLSLTVANFAMAKDGSRLRTLLAQAAGQTKIAAAKSVKIRVVDEKEYAEALKNVKTPVLVDFYADWCGPCRQLSPTIQKLADEYQGKVLVLKVNVDKAQNLVRTENIKSIPTVFILDKKGKVVERLVGPQPLEKYTKLLEQHLQNAEGP